MRLARHVFSLHPSFVLSRPICGALSGLFCARSEPKFCALTSRSSSLPRSARADGRRGIVASALPSAARQPSALPSAAWQHVGHEPSPLTASEIEHERNAPAPFAKADIKSMSPQEREALRVRSRSIPLVKSDAPLDIVFEDDIFLVVSKPSWIKMHPIHRFQGGTLLNRVIGYLGENDAHMCHRLDMHTSGVVIFLKAKQHCAFVSEAFRDRRVSKKYLCIVDILCSPKLEGGILPPFTIDAPIERHPDIGIMRQIGDISPTSKPAVTDFECVSASADGRTALLAVTPRHGRTHQIRIHAREADLPIVGDDVYGRERECYDSIEHVHSCASDPAKALFLDQCPLRAGLKLHAWQISVDHPVTRDRLTFSAPPPPRFLQLCKAYGLGLPDLENS